MKMKKITKSKKVTKPTKLEIVDLDVIHVEAKLNKDLSFTICFYGGYKKGSVKKMMKINMSFSLYWLKTFHDRLTGVANQVRDVINKSGF